MDSVPPVDLGRVITVHRCRHLVAWLCGALLTLAGLGLGIVYFFSRDVVYIGAAVMALPGGLLFLYWATVLSRRKAVVYESGLGLFRGSRTHLIPWTEIKQLQVESAPATSVGGTVNTYFILTNSGERLPVDDQYENIPTLIYAIQSGMVSVGNFSRG